ncbi:HSP20 family protein [Halogranum amylolyticum]|uniref:HSP20 family protein n=1 Tax=Halogranum amylolyticum TaxID=660520 RepID=A0A1H8MWQ0_9EURY|nr:Hsp20/alpha crystallin family protein [Halogranum amylolyticum]SEO21752.1 HSP20 family protein [Halogranum amylolyticum]
MTSTNPFRDVERMFERMSRQFDQMPWAHREEWDDLSSTEGIQIDLADHDDEFVVTADLPGFGKDDIDVQCSDSRVTIQAEHTEETEEREENYLRQERSQRSMRRTLTLPDPVDAEAVTATYNNGVLTLTLPKTEPDETSRQIDIE